MSVVGNCCKQMVFGNRRQVQHCTLTACLYVRFPSLPSPRLESEAYILAKPNLPLCQVIFDPGAKQSLTHVDVRPLTGLPSKVCLPSSRSGSTPFGSLPESAIPPRPGFDRSEPTIAIVLFFSRMQSWQFKFPYMKPLQRPTEHERVLPLHGASVAHTSV